MTLDLFFGGAENPHWAAMLADAGISTMGMSFVGLSRRVKFARPWLISSHFPENSRIFLDSGAYSVNKEDSDYTPDEVLELARSYMTFVSQNADAAEMISEFDAFALGQESIAKMREDFYDDLGDKFLPIWHSESGLDELSRLAASYARVGILQADVSTDLAPVLNGLVKQYGTLLYGVSMTRMDAMREIRWSGVGSTSWLSPSKFGDTILWEPATKTLHRYPRKLKDDSRKRHRSMLSTVGFNAPAVEAGNTEELLRLSIWSWQQFVAHINGTSVTRHRTEEIAGNADDAPGAVDNRGNETPNRELAIRPTIPIPGMGYKTGITRVPNDDGSESEVQESRIFRRSESARVCDNCFLKDKCTQFLPGANCAYNIPLVIETPSQIAALEDTIITMQAQRVIFMQMVEEMEGGYADPNLSSEIDRLGRLIKMRHEAEKEGFTLHVEGSQTRGSSMFAGLFGGPASEAAMPRFPAVSADEIIESTGIIDAEVIDEG